MVEVGQRKYKDSRIRNRAAKKKGQYRKEMLEVERELHLPQRQMGRDSGPVRSYRGRKG